MKNSTILFSKKSIIQILMLFVLLLNTNLLFSQSTYQCNNCSSNDINIKKVELVSTVSDGAGGYLPLPTTCLSGSTINGYLKITLDQNSTTRYGTQIEADVFVDGVIQQHIKYESCATTSSGTFYIYMPSYPNSISWSCGELLSLRNIIIGWGNSAMSNVCNETDCQLGPHCYKYDLTTNFIVITPIQPNFTAVGSCPANNSAQTYVFTSTTTGGVTPYTSFTWDITKNGIPISGSPFFGTPLTIDFSSYGAGDYQVTLTVVDSNSPPTTAVGAPTLITVGSCCIPSATCQLSSLTAEACTIPVAFTNPSDVFNFNACGKTVTMTSSDSGDTVICSDGDGADFIRTYTLFYNGVAFTTCNQTIKIDDLTAPVIAPLPALSTINCPATPVFATATATDNCGSFSLTFNDVTTPGNCAGSYSVTRTWTAKDGCNNTSTDSQTINVQDVTAPVIATLPAPSTINCPATPVFAQATASDACGSAFTLTFNDVTTPGNCAGSYSVTRTWTAKDGCNNTSTDSQTINVQDVTAPVIATLPAPSTINCPATPVFAQAIASDACGSAFTLTFNDVTTPGNCAGSYSVTRTWTAKDGCNNTSTDSQTINVQDVTAPVIATLPAPSTINCPATPVFAQAIASDACGSAFTLTFNDVTTPGNCAGSYSVTRTWTAKDGCNNTSTDSQTINVQDVTAPVIATLPAPSTINCPATPVFAQATASDACGSAFTLTFNDVTTPGNCAGSYSVIRTWTAKDGCNNTSTDSQTINVQDVTAPVIATLPAPSTINCPATPVFAQATASDACGSAFTLTFNDVTTPGNCAGSYSVTRTWTAKDGCNNTSTDSQTINVQDVTAPVIATLPAPSTINCPATPVFAQATASDACGSAFTLTFNDVTTPGNCAGSYSVTRTWTAKDGCNNTSTDSQTINVQDVTAPVIATLPAPSTINCPAIPVFAQATASDACGSAFTLTFNDVTTPGNCAGSYSVTRTWTAKDGCNNTSTDSQTINVQDVTAPVIATLPAPSTIDCPATPVFAQATASDTCGSSFTLTFNDVTTPGNCAGSYSVTRTWTATDSCNNTSTDSQTINVRDITAPILSDAPEDVTVECSAVPEPAVLTATDTCDATPIITFSETRANGDCLSNYILTRTWTATDACGNHSSKTQIITVHDTTDPIFSTQVLPENITVECDNVPDPVVLVATDNCDSEVQVIFTQIITGQDDSCSVEYVITRNWYVTDCAGNDIKHTQTINVEDTINPVFVGELPADTTVECDNVPAPVVLTATDNCDNNIQVIFTESISGQDDDCRVEYVIKRNWSVTDCAGNNTSHSQTINVEDTTKPLFVGELPADATVECDNVPAPVVLTATDNCDNSVQVVFTQTIAGQDDSCGAEYVITRNWSVTDCADNNNSHTQIINVKDTTRPIFVGELPADVTVQCDNVPAPVVLTATDNCDNQVQVVYTQTIAGQDDNCGAEYVITRNWSVTDCANNNTSHTQIITVEDRTRPIFVGELPTDVTVQCDNVPAPVVLTATDNCDNQVQVVYTQTIAGQDDNCGAEYVITRNWSVTDCAGNNTSHTQIINVEDTTNPVFTTEVLPGDITVSCESVPVPAVLTASDNCDNSVVITYSEVIHHNEEGCDSNYSITRTWVATDCAGNRTPHTQIITVIDQTAPILTTPLSTELNVSCGEIPPVPDLVFTDNCSTNVNIIFSENIINQNDYGYTIVRTWTVSDNCGNTNTFTQTIIVTIDTPFTYISHVTEPKCIQNPKIDLFSYLDSSIETSGTWLDVNNSGGLIGSILDPGQILPGTYVYRYTITEGSCPRIIEVHLAFKDCGEVAPCTTSDLKISKVVTPNNDGFNDYFKIGGIEECGFTYDVKIFNRWGALIYKNANYKNDWDGKAEGAISDSNLPAGTYYYIVNIVNSGFDVFNGYIYLGTKN